MNFDFLHVETMLHHVLDRAKQAGADHAVAILRKSYESTLRFALNDTTQHLETCNSDLTLAVSIDQREAMVQGNDLSQNALNDLATRAVDLARLTPQNPEFFPPVTTLDYPQTQTWFRSTAELSLEARGDAVRGMFDLAENSDVKLYGNLAVEDSTLLVANTSGLFAHQPYTMANLRVTARTPEGGGSGQNAVSEGDWRRLDPIRVAQRAIETALLSRDPQPGTPERQTVILSPAATLEYLTMLVFMMDQRSAELGQSFFSNQSTKNTRIGEQLFGEGITLRSIYDHPLLPTLGFGSGFGSGGSSVGRLFSMGLPMSNLTFIENGRLMRLYESPFWAVKNNRTPLAFPFNIVMDGTDSCIEDIILSTPRAVYISSFWYLGITDPNTISLTGLTRDGTFLIEDGRITKPLLNFRFNDSPMQSLNQISAIGQAEKAQAEFVTGITPSLRIENFNLSSISGAI